MLLITSGGGGGGAGTGGGFTIATNPAGLAALNGSAYTVNTIYNVAVGSGVSFSNIVVILLSTSSTGAGITRTADYATSGLAWVQIG